MALDFWIGAGGGANEVSDKAGILINPDVWKGLLNSLKLSVVAALGAGTAGFLAGYAIVRRRGSKLSAVVENLTFIPYLLPFISCMRELSLFVLLVTPANKVLTTILFQYNEKGWDQYANAINLVIVLIVLLVNYIVNKLTGASIDKGIGG